jgi:hypothetical protein
MLMTVDIDELMRFADELYALRVVKHDYAPKSDTKFFNQTQSKYRRKNWSIVMLFNNARCKALTPEVVNSETGLFLHQFVWLEDDYIGELPGEWNFLVGEYEKPAETPKLIHYTLGGPYVDGHEDCDYADHWFAERVRMLNVSR